MTDLLLATERGIARAAGMLRAGALVAFGTETVYGLGANATNERAVAGIFTAKQRPQFNPLICHYPNAFAVFEHVIADARAEKLAQAFWPGALTLVLPRRPNCPVAQLASAGLPTLAVRVPAHPIAQEFLQACAVPVAAPSANPSGTISPTTAQHVMAGLSGRIAAVLDCGACDVGLESTVLDLSTEQATLLRPGGVTREQIEAVIGPIALASAEDATAPRSPGMLLSHYAPKLPMRLNATSATPDEALLAFGPPCAGAETIFQLSQTENLTEAAANLFIGLHELDARGPALSLTRIAVMPVPDQDLGRAINDRLSRAAAPRELSQ